jgi:hypothetical protein
MNNAQFWKHELFRESSRFREAVREEGIDRLVARRSPLIERFVLVTAYMMRKLGEAQWLTVDVIRSGWKVQAFPCTSPPRHRRWFATSSDGNQLDGRTSASRKAPSSSRTAGRRRGHGTDRADRFLGSRSRSGTDVRWRRAGPGRHRVRSGASCP